MGFLVRPFIVNDPGVTGCPEDVSRHCTPVPTQAMEWVYLVHLGILQHSSRPCPQARCGAVSSLGKWRSGGESRTWRELLDLVFGTLFQARLGLLQQVCEFLDGIGGRGIWPCGRECANGAHPEGGEATKEGEHWSGCGREGVIRIKASENETRPGLPLPAQVLCEI